VTTLRPITEWPAADRHAVQGVFADIDDTLTTDGRFEARVLDAMERLRADGLAVFAITGRPAGWCDMIARMFPVDGVVGENGAFYFVYDRATKRMRRRFAHEDAARAENRRRLAALGEEILARVPGAALAADQAYREADLAIDFREDVAPLRREDIDEIVRVFEAHGATAKVSSIHVNGWFGDYDKLTMTRTMMQEVFGVDLAADRGAYVFVGDSPNDAPMFAFFPNAVGVANLAAFAERCPSLPAWLTEAPAGAGFIEVAESILAARRR